jgi:asparagine synthase (glutamine-hydrolysing)
MCGIVGFAGFEDKKLLHNMTTSLTHRGPDQHAYFLDDNISFGHRRLSIIDLSEKGRQPMCNEEGNLTITFNGEIYNYKELRETLNQLGHKFNSNTDTEVILYAYQEYGPTCVTKLNGCFAFAIYNSNTKSLFLARDRMGIKPLYYAHINDHFYFASEIKAILAAEEIKREVNLSALNSYLSYYANTKSETMFKGIHKLPPGHTLTYKDNKVTIEKYWNLQMNPVEQPNSQKQLLELLQDSVQKRLMSDVPLGVYLSGGVDSGSVVSLMKNVTNNIKTFSVGFSNDSKKTELAGAKIAADYFGTDHHEIIVDLKSIKHLPNIVYHQDEPMGDPTSIPTYLLSQQAKKKVTVVLTGEGADEQFAGYEQEKFMLLHQKYLQKIPLALRKPLTYPLAKLPAKALNPIFKYMGQLGDEGKRRLIEFINSATTAEQLLSIISIFSDTEKKQLTQGQLHQEIITNQTTNNLNKTYFSQKQQLLNSLLLFENKEVLTENLLMKVDKNTMAHGVEARVPFLDHRVVEFAASLPEKQKLRSLKDKYILRQTMQKHLPPKRSKQKKERFFVPINHWLKSELSSLSKDLLSKQTITKQGYFDYHYIQKAFENYNSSPLFYSRQLWTLLNFQLWHKMFIDREKVTI